MIARPSRGKKWHRVIGEPGVRHEHKVGLACNGRRVYVAITFKDKHEFKKITGNEIKDMEICNHRPCREERRA